MRLRAKHGGQVVTLGPQIGSGGQGTVYRDANRPDIALKLLDHPPPDFEQKLEAMIAHHPFIGVPKRSGHTVPMGTRIANGWWAYGRKGPYRPPKSAPPFDGLPTDIRSLFRQCFEDGHADPIRRPAAQTWADALDAWLVAGGHPPTSTPVATRTPVRVPEWLARTTEWVRRYPRRAVLAGVAALGLVAGGMWWVNREPEPPGPGGEPTPALWKKLRPKSGR